MSKLKNQSGSAHIIVVIILVVALMGALGFVFYQNFIQKTNTTETATVDDEVKSDSNNVANGTTTVYKTYTMDEYGASFEYPDTWSVVKSEISPTSFVVKNTASGDVLASYKSVSGIGGACREMVTYKVIDVEQINITTINPVAFSFTVAPNETGNMYDSRYGVSQTYTRLGDGEVCPNTFYYYFLLGSSDNPTGASFAGSKQFASIAEAEAYMNSDEYKEIKKMILSLKYN